jgi:hypothetical protein
MTLDRDVVLESRGSLAELEPGVRDRVLALDEPVAWDDWSDVVRRSRRTLSPLRRLGGVRALAAIPVAIAAIAIAGPAFGLRLSSIIDFGSSGSAPAPMRHVFSEFDLSAPAELAPGAIASQTRVITSVQMSDGSHTLYVSPTKQGGFCFEWTGGSGFCDQLGTTPLGIVWESDRVVGTAASAYVSSVKIEFRDGTSAEPSITWISAPINAGFFLYDIPAGKTVTEIDGYGADGTLVSREHRGGEPGNSASPPEFALTDQASIALTVSTPDGTAIAYTAPSTTDGTCAWFELAGTNIPLYGFGGCMPHGYAPEGTAFRFAHVGNSILFAGRAAPRYTRFTLQLPDGTTATVTPTPEGLMLFSFPASLTSRPGPVTVTAYGADGQVIFSVPTTDAAPTAPTLRPGEVIPSP